MPFMGLLVEEIISEFEALTVETSRTKREMTGKKKKVHDIQELWDNYKKCNICIMGIPERVE